MTDFMAAMLNELMGPARNALPGESAGIDFDHPDVCRDFLVGFCFHEAFRNTKNDLGYCPKPNHDVAMRKRYKESNRYWRLGYEEKFLEKARRFSAEVRRKIEKNEERLRHTQGDLSASAAAVEKKREDIKVLRDQLGTRIEKLMVEAQVEGERGNVAAAQSAVEKADELTREKRALDKEEEALDEDARRSMAFEDQITAGNRQMQVCKVCGCFMLTNDAQSRIDDHLGGKLHIAYLKIQEHLEEIEKEREERKKMQEDEVRESKNERKDERDRNERDRDRDRERDRRDRDRDRRSSRRSRSRDRRDRNRERDRRDDKERRDRDRRRSRSRDRHHR